MGSQNYELIFLNGRNSDFLPLQDRGALLWMSGKYWVAKPQSGEGKKNWCDESTEWPCDMKSPPTETDYSVLKNSRGDNVNKRTVTMHSCSLL